MTVEWSASSVTSISPAVERKGRPPFDNSDVKRRYLCETVESETAEEYCLAPMARAGYDALLTQLYRINSHHPVKLGLSNIQRLNDALGRPSAPR